jgi:hypothetical protein
VLNDSRQTCQYDGENRQITGSVRKIELCRHNPAYWFL